MQLTLVHRRLPSSPALGPKISLEPFIAARTASNQPSMAQDVHESSGMSNHAVHFSMPMLQSARVALSICLTPSVSRAGCLLPTD